MAGERIVAEILGAGGYAANIVAHIVCSKEGVLVDHYAINKAYDLGITHHAVKPVAVVHPLLCDNAQGVVLGIVDKFAIAVRCHGIVLTAGIPVGKIPVGLDNLARSGEIKHLLDIDGVVGLETAGGVPIVVFAVLGVLGKQSLKDGLDLTKASLVEHLLYRIPALGVSTGSNEAYYSK